jgi:hypothetical protein
MPNRIDRKMNSVAYSSIWTRKFSNLSSLFNTAVRVVIAKVVSQVVVCNLVQLVFTIVNMDEGFQQAEYRRGKAWLIVLVVFGDKRETDAGKEHRHTLLS